MLQNMYKIIHTTRHAGVKLPPPLVALESNSSLESCNQHAMLERGNMGWYMGGRGAIRAESMLWVPIADLVPLHWRARTVARLCCTMPNHTEWRCFWFIIDNAT